MCPVRKWEVKLFPKEKKEKKRKQVIRFGLNNWKRRKSKHSWLLGCELTCCFAVVKQVPGWGPGRWAICLRKSLNYLVKSVGAQSLASYRISDVLFIQGRIQIKQHGCVYFVPKKEKERREGRKGRWERRKWTEGGRKGRKKQLRRKRGQEVTFPEIQSPTSKSHTRNACWACGWVRVTSGHRTLRDRDLTKCRACTCLWPSVVPPTRLSLARFLDV